MHMRFFSFLTLVLAAAPAVSMAQEMLVPLSGNPQLEAASEALKRSGANASRSGDTLNLPFFDDFSEPFSRENFPFDFYPDQEKWKGRSVYVNDHMAIDPISVGVATFDGLDSAGLSYGWGFTIPTASDTLQSRPIDLSNTTDSVYLSFHYQAQGRGLAPAFNDILSLEFRDTAGLWQQVWQANGYVLQDSLFRRAMVPVVGEEFLYRGFQFQFINYAALAGAVDHWHVDYVLLDDQRTFTDTVYQDVALVEGTLSLLTNYFTLPWAHFKTDPGRYVAGNRFFRLRNNLNATAPVTYNFRVSDRLDNAIGSFPPSTAQVLPLTVCDNERNDCGLPGEIFFNDLDDFSLPTDVEISFDSSHFFIETNISSTDDTEPSNNIILKKLRFYNYYAYDDGTAEVGFGLGNLQFPGRVAIRYDAMMRDTLRAIQYYFNPVGADLSQEPVRFYVWSGDSIPEQVIYESEEITFDYSTGINFMNHFFLDELIDLDGTFFIGWSQQPVSGQKFSVGFDRQHDASHRVFYNLGTGWIQSAIPGAVMFRPVFGRPYELPIGVEEADEMPSMTVFPNPANDRIHVRCGVPGCEEGMTVRITDLTGRTVHTQRGAAAGVDVVQLSRGTYILEAVLPDGRRSSHRIILTP
jgi:hypothetical protein